MAERRTDRPEPGGIIHTYRRYDPQRFPMPAAEAPDLVSPAFEHLLHYGSLRGLTEEQLAEAVEIDPRRIRGLGPSLTALIAMLEERRRKILETYETGTVQEQADRHFHRAAQAIRPPQDVQAAYQTAVRDEQLADLERLWYRVGQRSDFARQLVPLIQHLGNKYEIEELAAKYAFAGRRGLSIDKALEIKEELEAIDRLIEQLRQAAKDAKVYVINMDELARFVDEADLEELEGMRRQVAEMLRQMAEQQGIRKHDDGQYNLTPKAYKIFQTKLLDRIFDDIQAAKSGRHHVEINGDGAVEMQRTKPYEFGDSLANMDVGQSMINALIREAGQGHVQTAATSEPGSVNPVNAQNPVHIQNLVNTPDPVNAEDPMHAQGRLTNSQSDSRGRTGLTEPGSEGRGTVDPKCKTPKPRIRLLPEDIEIHLTRNNPKCATVVCMDMSGSMRWGGQYVNVKRMALALHGLIRSEYPGDFVDFIEICTLPRRRHVAEVAELLPRPVTIFDPVVRLKADMSDEAISEMAIHPHFTNIQHALALARRTLQVQDTPNRQIILITDGLPTAHFEDTWLYMLYPPDPRTERHTLREGLLCRDQNITINIFLLSNWAQSEEDVQFANRLAESTAGRVFFVGGTELDRYVVWDYLERRRFIYG